MRIKKKTKNVSAFTLRMPVPFRKRIEKAAKVAGVSLNDAILQLLGAR